MENLIFEILKMAGFIVVLCGTIMRMPGLPKKPAAVNITLDENGDTVGLF